MIKLPRTRSDNDRVEGTTAKRRTQRPAAATPKPALTLKVEGPDIRPGRIPVRDLLVICEHAQSAVNRQAEAMEGRQTLRPGPKIGKVRQECSLDFVSIGKGSATLSFDPSKPQQTLPRMRTLSDDAIVAVAEAVAAISKGTRVEVDPGVLDSLKNMGALFGNGVRSIKWIVPARPGRKKVAATFNAKVQRRIVEKLAPPVTRPVTLQGTLEMADFKPSDQKCRIHPPLQTPIICTFGPELADEVYANLRFPVEIDGTAAINGQTGKTESIAIKKVKPLDPLMVNAGSFFRGWSLEHLAQMQGVEPLRDPKSLAGGWPDDEDLDAALAEIYQQRD